MPMMDIASISMRYLSDAAPKHRVTKTEKLFVKKLLWRIVSRWKFLRGPSVRYCGHHALLPAVLSATSSSDARRAMLLPPGTSETQLNQDLFALIANRFRSGYFVEIGANDGQTLSNTLYLEECFDWNGVLIEANPKYQQSLGERRAASAIVAIAEKKGIAEFVDSGLFGGLSDSLDDHHSGKTAGAPRIQVECDTLDSVLNRFDAPRVVDFISVDVEGGEQAVVEQFVESDRRFRCGCIEVNTRESDRIRIVEKLQNANYVVLWDRMTGHDLFFIDSTQNVDLN